jgi:hypothetical protein
MPSVRNVGEANPGKKAMMEDGKEALLTAENAHNAQRRFCPLYAVLVVFVVKQFSRLPISGLRIGSTAGALVGTCARKRVPTYAALFRMPLRYGALQSRLIKANQG